MPLGTFRVHRLSKLFLASVLDHSSNGKFVVNKVKNLIDGRSSIPVTVFILLTIIFYFICFLSFLFHLNHRDVEILNMLFNTNDARGGFSSRQIDVFFLFSPRKSDSINGIVSMKCRILFFWEKKKNISKCSLLKSLLNMLNVYTKNVFTRVMMSSYSIRIAKVKIKLCMRTVSSGSSLDCFCPFKYSIDSINFVSGQKS